MEELETANHPSELPRSGDITVNLDYRQMGVGGVNSWGAWPLKKYQLQPKPYSYSFRLSALKAGDDPAERANVAPAFSR